MHAAAMLPLRRPQSHLFAVKGIVAVRFAFRRSKVRILLDYFAAKGKSWRRLASRRRPADVLQQKDCGGKVAPGRCLSDSVLAYRNVYDSAKVQKDLYLSSKR